MSDQTSNAPELQNKCDYRGNLRYTTVLAATLEIIKCIMAKGSRYKRSQNLFPAHAETLADAAQS